VYPTTPSSINERPGVELRRVGQGAGDGVDHARSRILAGARYQEVSDAIETINIVEGNRFERGGGVVILMYILLERFEYLGAV
jgi:hypothetical protein